MCDLDVLGIMDIIIVQLNYLLIDNSLCLPFTCESVYKYHNAMISWEDTKSVYEYVYKSSNRIISWENTNIM